MAVVFVSLMISSAPFRVMEQREVNGTSTAKLFYMTESVVNGTSQRVILTPPSPPVAAASVSAPFVTMGS